MWFWKAQGLPDVLARWGEGLPPERIHVVTVPQSGAPRDLLWERYCEAFGIDPAWAPAESDRENVSIGIAETALLRKLNRRFKRVGLKGDDYRRIVRQLMVHDTLAHRGDDPSHAPAGGVPVGRGGRRRVGGVDQGLGRPRRR